MHTRTRLARYVIAATIAAGLVTAGASATAVRPPKLIVLLVVDQFRGDYVDRFGGKWTGGLRRLFDRGAWFRQADYTYYSTVTCAGHSTIATGALPSTHGMIANTWWDRTLQKEVGCVEDANATLVTYGQALAGVGASAHALRTPTIADELRAQLPKSRSLAFSLKPRSAVTLVGQRGSAVTWLDDRGEWATSNSYAQEPVQAIADFIRAHPIENDLGRSWDRLLPLDQYLFESTAIAATPTAGMTTRFPHVLSSAGGKADRMFFDQWQSSPFADAYLADMALFATERFALGRDGDTDYLAISFSPLDKVGHDFGPRSHEIQDILLRLDQTLARFLDGLDRIVGPGNYVVALSADHGVAPIPEAARVSGLQAGRLSTKTIETVVEDALRPLGIGTHVAKVIYNEVYLTPGTWPLLKENPALIADVKSRLKDVPGVSAVFTREERARTGDGDDLETRLARSFDSERSGDLSVLLDPYWLFQTSGTSHGTAHRYDTRVPIVLMGAGIATGEYLQPVSPADIAPTLAFLAGVTLPQAQGRVLVEALAPATTSRP